MSVPKANKELGQHFLKDKNVIHEITSNYQKEAKAIIEVGPGPGVLTKSLSESKKPLYLIEMDTRFLEILKDLVPRENIFFEDALKFKLEEFIQKNKLEEIWLVSNLPYNISAPLFLKFLKIEKIKYMTLMFQKEVGEKTYLIPSKKNQMSSLTALSLTYFEANLLKKVSPGAFLPPPKVESVVVSYKRNEMPTIKLNEFNQFESYLRTIFSEKRKQLGKILKDRYKNKNIEETLQTLKIDKTRRAETLDIHEVQDLFKKIFYSLLLILFFNENAFSNFSDSFGASSENIAIGNQGSFSSNPANNLYAPALLGEEKPGYSFSFFNHRPKLKNINNVVIKNPKNSNSAVPEKGDVKNNYASFNMLGVHALLPFIGKTKLATSFMIPLSKFAEISTGDSYLPEYVLYRARNYRTSFRASLVSSFNDKYSYSIGINGTMSGNGESEIIGNTSGGEPSSGKLIFSAKPSFAPQISIAEKGENFKRYFSFQDYLKSEFKNKVYGMSPVPGNASIPFNINLNSLMYFDPRIYRIGQIVKKKNFTYYASIEYQDWSEYKTPKLTIKNNGGVITSSASEEKLDLKNGIIPHLGLSYDINEQKVLAGISYRPKVIYSNLSNGGNSLDTDIFNISLGHSFSFFLLEKKINFTSAYLLQTLKEKRIKIHDNTRLGAPGYTLGGQIHILTFGINWLI